jgi:sulfoxide reductase heme-binding subunit YedZ
MHTLKRKWLVSSFNLLILMIFLPLVLPFLNPEHQLFLFSGEFIGASYGSIASYDFRMTGRWAIRLLIISLAISPMVYLFGWRKLVPLRKWAGLWAFVFAGSHILYFIGDYTRGKIWGQDFTYVGLAAFVILSALALTSHRWAMKLLGRNWKRLHRLVYIAGVMVVLHALNGIIFYQKLPDYNFVITEMQVYGFIIGMLLLLRIPQVRYGLRSLFRLPKQKNEKVKNMA